jgi:hypothetical protein
MGSPKKGLLIEGRCISLFVKYPKKNAPYKDNFFVIADVTYIKKHACF